MNKNKIKELIKLFVVTFISSLIIFGLCFYFYIWLSLKVGG